jgi:hypothetical protein
MASSRRVLAVTLFLVVDAVCTILKAAEDKPSPEPQAPASGRLAAAIATNWAIRRPIRDGVERSNERTRRILKTLPRRPGENRL